MIAFTRDPSASLASTIGEESSMRRPTAETIRSMTCIRCRLSRNRTSVRCSFPSISTYTWPLVFTRMSEIRLSRISGSSGPRPNTSLMTCSTSISRSSRLSGVSSEASRSRTIFRTSSSASP